MTPKHFATLAAVAAISLLAAIAVYAARAPWTQETTGSDPLLPALADKADKVARISITQGGKSFVIEKSGERWLVSSAGGYPASAEKVRTLLTSLKDAKVLEPKTRNPERYAILEVDDPAGKNSSARLIKLEDAGGAAIAEIIAGKARTAAAVSPDTASGQGTYVRRPGEEQSWLASTAIAGAPTLKDWAGGRVFETETEKIKTLTVEVAGEAPYTIKRGADNGHELAVIPPGKKIKYVNMIDNIIEAASFLDLEGVRKQTGAAGGDAGKVSFEMDDGLKITMKIRREKDGAWATLDVSGEGSAKAKADEIAARAKDWEFEILPSKVDTMLKKEADLLEDAAS